MSFSSKTEGSKLVLSNIIKTCEHRLSLELINLFHSDTEVKTSKGCGEFKLYGFNCKIKFTFFNAIGVNVIKT